MFKKLALAAVTLASLLTASVAMSGAAQADDAWMWRRHHHMGGNWGGPHPGGDNWGGGQFHHGFHGYNGGYGWGGPAFYFGAPVFWGEPDYYPYYDDAPVYWHHHYRHCRIKHVRHHHHWVAKRVCYRY